MYDIKKYWVFIHWLIGEAGLCDGSERDMEVCNDSPCQNPINTCWSKWSDWGQCSQSCGGGLKERRRVCQNIDNKCDGPG